MTEHDMVMVNISYDSGPNVSYYRSDSTEERAGHSSEDVLVPRVLWEEYERLSRRVHEIEESFDGLAEGLRRG